MTDPTLDFDLEEVWKLKNVYDTNLVFIKSHLPDIDWNSRIKLKNFFKERLDIDLENATISHIASHLARYDHDSEEYDLINGICTYLRIKYVLKNYIDYIIKHEGCVPLRLENGEWLQGNKRPVSRSPEIMVCQRKQVD